jgi:hypothetical protein
MNDSEHNALRAALAQRFSCQLGTSSEMRKLSAALASAIMSSRGLGVVLIPLEPSPTAGAYTVRVVPGVAEVRDQYDADHPLVSLRLLAGSQMTPTAARLLAAQLIDAARVSESEVIWSERRRQFAAAVDEQAGRTTAEPADLLDLLGAS